MKTAVNTIVLLASAAALTAHSAFCAPEDKETDETAPPVVRRPFRPMSAQRLARTPGVPMDIGIPGLMRDDLPTFGKKEVLERPLKLTFKLVPQTRKDQDLSILCATKDYALSVEFTRLDERFHFEVSGEVRLLENDRVLVLHRATLDHRAKEEETSVNAEGSSVLRIGQEKTVAKLGDRGLVVTVSLDE